MIRRDYYLAYMFFLDFVDGWITPASQLNVEAEELYSSGLRTGYAIYYTSRYVPKSIPPFMSTSTIIYQ
ncbi:MAG: hypothetical protein QW382_04010 [Nitrososphaerota archaeon]